jgi:hypothetical protein
VKYTNKLKGATTQSVLKAMLERAGYRVIPLGIEEVVREVTDLDKVKYLRMGFPEALRHMPDFLVTDWDQQKSWLVEVKYRRKWSPEFHARLETDLRDQLRYWSPLNVLIFLGEPSNPTSAPAASRLRIAKLRLEGEDVLAEWSEGGPPTPGNSQRWVDGQWTNLHRIQDVFTRVQQQFGERTIEKSISVLEFLRTLDEPQEGPKKSAPSDRGASVGRLAS